jgi:hypothetical protein
VKQAFGAILILGSLAFGWEAFREWQALNDLGGFGTLIGAMGGPSKEDAIVKGVISAVAMILGIGLLNSE